MDTKHAAETFWDQGYLVLEDFFEHSLMDELHSLIIKHFDHGVESVLNDEFADRSKCEIVPWFPQREGPSAFDKIDQLEVLDSLSAAILGENWVNLYSMVMFSAQGTKGQAWHQDCPPETPERYNLNRLVYTRDITDAIGGQVVLVPRTHRNRELPAGDPDVEFDDQMTLYPKKGTLVLLHGHTWHRVLPVKGAYRVSTNSRAAPANTPADVTDVCVYRNMRYQFSSNRVIEERVSLTQ